MSISEAPKSHKIKIKLINYKSSNSKQIVDTAKTINKKPKDAKFFGKNNNWTARETVSSKTASFKEAGVGNSNRETKESSSAFKNIKFSDLGVKNKFHKKPSRKLAQGVQNGNRKLKGKGSTNDYIQDMPLGDFTRLNTQEYEFYGFYHRIKQKLEQFWGRNIQEQAEKFFKTGRAMASDKNLLTSLAITLNDVGEIINVKVKSTSGLSELDNAAIKSFNEAGPFPNPPKKMLKNGKAIIEWGFVVNT